jgi:NTE family protein
LKAFGIFEGGGVRGYAHIGALAAVEHRNIEFEAVAGTSIGAILAALVAAGYRSHELFTVEDGVQSGVAAVAVPELFHPADFRTAERVRADLARYDWLARQWRRLHLPTLPDFRSPFLVMLSAWLAVPALWVCAPIIYFRHRRAASQLWRRFGLVDARAVRTWLDQVLRAKLGLGDLERELEFGDLPMDLRVVVSDVASKSMRVVGANAREPLVDSVIASASYPLFFTPDSSGGKSLVDGGILSNLPAWVFDRQRAASPVCIPTLAFRLVAAEKSDDRGLRTLAYFVPRLIETMLDGARDLQFRRIDEHHLIPLPANIEVLAFQKIGHQRQALIDAGRQAADAYFENHFVPTDPANTELLKNLAAQVRQLLGTTAFVRAWVLVPADDEYLRVAYAANMEEDADDQLLVRRHSPGVASAFSRREPVLVNLPLVAERYRKDPYFKYEHALRAESAQTQLSRQDPFAN